MLTIGIGTTHADTVTFTYDSLNRLTNAAYSDGSSESYSYDNAGNRMSRFASAATVQGGSLTVIVNNVTRMYGTTNPPFTVSYIGFVNGDTTNVLSGAPLLTTSAGINSPVGIYTITNTIGNLVATNYTVSLVDGSLTVTGAVLMITTNTGIAANNKVYDGTTAATISSNNVVLAGILPGDTISLSTNGYMAAFSSAAAGNGITVTVNGLTLTGADATNYTLMQPVELTANITPAVLTIASPGIAANNKVYDATTVAGLTSNNVILIGVVHGDTVSLSTNGYAANFATPNVGTGIPVVVSGLSLSGPSAANYTLTPPRTLVADISPAILTVSASSSSKTCGLPNPTLTAIYSGFVDAEGTNVLIGAPSLSTSATIYSPPGVYVIMIGPGTLSAANYAFSFINGTLTVAAVPQLSVVPLSVSQFVLFWPTMANQIYQLESSTNLTPAVWTPQGAPIAGSGQPIIVTNGLNAPPQRFFRIKIDQSP